MKIRKELAHIYKELSREIRLAIEEHHCGDHTKEGMGCVLCALNIINKPLVLIHYLKNKGMIGHLGGEEKLLDILGAERLKQKIKSDLDSVRNTPKKKCFNCGKVVAMWMPYSQAALFINSKPNKEVSIKCHNCGVFVYFSGQEIKYKKPKDQSVRELILAVQLASRLGYNDINPNPDEQENEDFDPDQNQDNDDFYDPDE